MPLLLLLLLLSPLAPSCARTPQEGSKHYYLALDVYVEGNWENPLAQICLTFLTFWILLSYLVPISLFVTLEIVKFWQVRARRLGPAL